MFRKDIQNVIRDSDIPVFRQDQVVALFNDCFYKYLIQGKDTTFTTTELNDFWFYLKVELLTKNIQDERCRKLLSQLLNKYAKKYENSKYRIC